MTSTPLLSVRDLSVAFTQSGQTTLAVDRIAKGETLALVGGSRAVQRAHPRYDARAAVGESR